MKLIYFLMKIGSTKCSDLQTTRIFFASQRSPMNDKSWMFFASDLNKNVQQSSCTENPHFDNFFQIQACKSQNYETGK